jgi:S-DNA-T family DNA segregation ATPase FtsK/SpoIIIE
MAKKKTRTTKQPRAARKKLSFVLSDQQKILLGSFLFFLGVAMIFSFVSYFFSWQADQSAVGEFASRELESKIGSRSLEQT